MRAKALVPILAEIFGVHPETAFVIDRGLAEAGYRAKGKGRSWPEMSRQEALYFLIACMTSTAAKGKVASRAAEDVALWARATSDVRVKWTETFEDDAAALGLDPAKAGFEPEVVDRSEKLPMLSGMHGKTVTLIDFLLKLMSDLDRIRDLDAMRFTLSPSHLDATIKVHVGFGLFDDQTFFVLDEPEGYSAPPDGGGIRTDISVDGTFLAAIAARTEDPHLEVRQDA